MRSSGRRARQGSSFGFLDLVVVTLALVASGWLFFGGGESVLSAPWWAQLIVAVALGGGILWAILRLRSRAQTGVDTAQPASDDDVPERGEGNR
jgi:hypothetical protein